MNELIYDKFERYHKGLMGEMEAKEFAAELERDERLESHYREYKIALKAIDVSIADDLRKQFRLSDQASSPAGRTIRVVKMAARWAAVAAVVLSAALAVTTWYEVSSLNNMVENELFYAYKTETLRSDQQSSSDLAAQLEKADYLYVQKEYEEAIALYRLIQQEASPDDILVSAATFHECLALYRSKGRHPSFEKLLDRIADDAGHPYQKKASAFREQLNKTVVRLLKG